MPVSCRIKLSGSVSPSLSRSKSISFDTDTESDSDSDGYAVRMDWSSKYGGAASFPLRFGVHGLLSTPMQLDGQKNVPEESVERPTLAHVVPFIAWLFIAYMLGDPDGWKYAVRSVACLGLLLWLRPWRWYPGIQLRNLPLALLVGVGVCWAWIVGESHWVREHIPGFHDMYARYAVLPWGELREADVGVNYAPEVTGWPLALVRIAGSALVIAIIEEFFWRGWLYRWMQGRNFLKVDPGTFDKFAFFGVAAVFGVEHNEWLAGVVAGLAYGWMYLKTRDIWAVAIAHAITNGLLGWYVVEAGAYWFWSG